MLAEISGRFGRQLPRPELLHLRHALERLQHAVGRLQERRDLLALVEGQLVERLRQPGGVHLLDAGVGPVSAPGQEQVATAFIVVAPGAETTGQELLAWCQEHLAAHQVPAAVTFVDRLPRNSVGKLIRADLKALPPVTGVT